MKQDGKNDDLVSKVENITSFMAGIIAIFGILYIILSLVCPYLHIMIALTVVGAIFGMFCVIFSYFMLPLLCNSRGDCPCLLKNLTS